MRYAIISDIHGNAEALDAVTADIEGAGVDRVVCLGDVVGYGADPVKCLERVRGSGIETILGNHDSAAAGDTPLDYFNPYAKEAVIWTAGELGEEEKRWLAKLPLVRIHDDFEIVHATLFRPREWGYIFDYASARACFDEMKKPVCFIGHSHVPLVFSEKGSIDCEPAQGGRLAGDARYIINVGSVGQPRDGDQRACYAVFDTSSRKLEIRRVAYGVKAAQEKIIAAGLPAFLALRLGAGR